MLRFYRNIVLLALLNLGIFLGMLLAIHTVFIQKHWQTDYDVFTIPNNQTYQFVILGTSHAQNFTRFANQTIVEKILGEHFYNLSQPNAGPLMEKIYLQYFLNKGNRTNTVIYFIDPPVFYTDQDNENYNVRPLYGEFEFPLEALLIQNHIGLETQLSYFKTYMSLKWFIKSPRPNAPDANIYEPNLIYDSERLTMLYPSGLQKKTFDHYVLILNDLIQLCAEHHMKLVFVMPPTLIKNYPGINHLRALLKDYKKKQGIPYYDYSQSETNKRLFSNIDHLNTAGITEFTKKYLKQMPEIKKKTNTAVHR